MKGCKIIKNKNVKTQPIVVVFLCLPIFGVQKFYDYFKNVLKSFGKFYKMCHNISVKRRNYMRCIFCGHNDSKVVDSRYLKDTSIRRRRECLVCGKRFTTYETVESNPMVVTNVFNEREPFKVEKLTESIKCATYCADLSVSVEEIVSKIESNLLKLQQQEISTKDIVSVALDVLMEVNSMACLVYYTQHTDCSNFDDVRRFINR